MDCQEHRVNSSFYQSIIVVQIALLEKEMKPEVSKSILHPKKGNGVKHYSLFSNLSGINRIIVSTVLVHVLQNFRDLYPIPKFHF